MAAIESLQELQFGTLPPALSRLGGYIPADEPSAAHLLVQQHSSRAPGNRGHHSRGYGTPALDEPDASRKEHEMPAQFLSELLHA